MNQIAEKVVIAGGSGFLGQALAASFLREGTDVVILGRKEKKGMLGRFSYWNAKSLGSWQSELDGSSALINLSGHSIDCRYTKKNKSLILNSRIDSTKVLGQAITALKSPPPVWLNASTATVYPDIRGNVPPHNENSNTDAPGFAEEVGRAWEKSFFESSCEGVRQVAMRISIVLGKQGGAFPVMQRLTKMGLGGQQGSGTQWVSWLHIDDWVGIAKFLLMKDEVEGSVNLASPNPVTNHEFMQVMRREFAPFGIGFPAPTFAVHLGGIILGTSPDLVLKSRKLVSLKLKTHCYSFFYNDLGMALASLC